MSKQPFIGATFILLIIQFFIFPSDVLALTAPDISYGETKTGTINPATEIDKLKFYGQPGEKVLIALRNTSGGNFDPFVVLENAIGGQIASVYAGDAGTLIAVLPAGYKTFFIKIYDSGADSTGTYEITLERLNKPVKVTTLVFNQTLNTTLSNVTSQDVFSFTAQAGDKIILAARDLAGGNLDLYFLLRDAVGAAIGTPVYIDDAGNFTATIPVSGTYYIWAWDSSYDGAGNYQATLERLNNPVGVTSTTWDQTVNATLSNVTSQDVFGFTAQAGDKVLFAVRDLSGGLFDLYFILRDATGTDIGTPFYIDDVGNLVATIPSNGTYYIWAWDSSYDGAGNYQATLERLNNPVATAINWDQPINASIGNVTEQDVFNFNADSGDELIIDISSGSPDLWLTLRDINGDQLHQEYVSTQGTVNYTIPANGTYYLWFWDDAYDMTGAYQFTLSGKLVKNFTVTPIFFNPSIAQTTSLQFDLERNSNVTVKFYQSYFDSQGSYQKVFVDTLINNAPYAKGPVNIPWDGKNSTSVIQPSSAYVISVEAFSTTDTRHMLYDPEYSGTEVVNFSSGGISVPNFDPYQGETAILTYDLVSPAFVSILAGVPYVLNASRTIIFNQPRDTANNTDHWDGRDDYGHIVPPGSYVVYGWPVALPQNAVVLTDSLGTQAAVNPYAIYPRNGEITEITYNLAIAGTVRLLIKNPNGLTVRTLINNVSQPAGNYTIVWDGKDDTGAVVADEGNYRVSVMLTDGISNQETVERNLTIFK